jgi:hypothetical protein
VAAIIYSLCAALALGVAVLLWRQYAKSRSRLAFWIACCFTGLAANNVLLVIDKLVVPDTDLVLLRHGIALVSMSLLLFGLIYEEE